MSIAYLWKIKFEFNRLFYDIQETLNSDIMSICNEMTRKQTRNQEIEKPIIEDTRVKNKRNRTHLHCPPPPPGRPQLYSDYPPPPRDNQSSQNQDSMAIH